MFSANGTVAHFGGLSDDALSLSDSVSQHFSPEVENALLGVQFIAQHIRDNDKENEVLTLCEHSRIYFGYSGHGGLEVHGHGPGQALPVALHPDLPDGYRVHHPTSSQPVRHEGAHRCSPHNNWKLSYFYHKLFIQRLFIIDMLIT